MSARLLITGCTGTVAGPLTAALRSALPNATLIGASRTARRVAAPWDEHHAVDLGVPRSVELLVGETRPDGVFHLASLRSGSAAKLERVNVDGTAHLLAAMRMLRGPTFRVLVLGSAAELGDLAPSDLPAGEGAPTRPVDAYGISKLEQAQVTEAAHAREGQDVVRVRLFNLLGPGLPPTLLPGRCVTLLAGVLRGAAPRLVFGDLETVRDYADVRDLARGIVQAYLGAPAGALYHLGSGRGRTGREVVQALIAAAGPEVGPVEVVSEPHGPAGVRALVADPGRARGARLGPRDPVRALGGRYVARGAHRDRDR
ncbi:MAG TPA: NAD(P)-dependent oxidoreductase [Candidatus Limnocylindria bacterium]|nr:NAD(P)-dependent oxidoreductase [Candidatus Limnocylindria bacterium]